MRVSRANVEKERREYIKNKIPYSMTRWDSFDYTHLENCISVRKKAGRGQNVSYNDIIIMADTETSKGHENTFKYEEKEINGCVVKLKKYNPVANYIVAWTISLRAYDTNIVTLYGSRPADFIECLKCLRQSLRGDEIYIYWHNMSYDWVFVRKHMFRTLGHPEHQLNTKSHNPIYVKFANGIVFKDSLILAQRKLEKWADDLDVEHKKAVGKWDYNKIRTQDGNFTPDELTYIENDTLAGVECIDATMKALNKHIYSMPFTATGIPREECRKIAKKNNGRQTFLSMVLNYEQYIQAIRVYHGGYTHANRYVIDKLIIGVACYDFSSSYPFCMVSEKYPIERFNDYEDCSLDDICDMGDKYAFMFKLILVNPRLKDAHNPMPALQYSKCTSCINPVVDNGRILAADYVEIYLNEIDGEIIRDTYHYDKHICTSVVYATKDYLPRWFTDYVYSLYEAKCKLKNGDPVLYSIAKSKLNSLYGMCCQKSIKENLVEDYVTGDYEVQATLNENGEPMTDEDLYNKFVNNNNSILPYQWGIYVTSYAMRNLFTLAKCCVDSDGWSHFCYSDTDSVYSDYWNEDLLNEYNENALAKLQANGYEPVEVDGERFILGVAEFDGHYSEFKVTGAKRYCCRYSNDLRNKAKNRGKLKITVAGVPKDAVKCLNDDINLFTDGFIFHGEDTGKLTHHYIIADSIYNENGIEYGDSVDLTPCDYLLSSIEVLDIEDMLTEEIEVQIYD